MGSKSDTLRNVQTRLSIFVVPNFISFYIKAYDFSKVVDLIRKNVKSSKLVIRSSAEDEDTNSSSSSEGVRQIKSAFHSALESGKLLGKEVENSYMTDLLQSIINMGGIVTSVQINEDWVEVDTVEDLHAPITLERVKRIRVI